MPTSQIRSEHDRICEAYMRMAREARYRPAALGDGCGGVELCKEELRDSRRLQAEASSYADRFLEEEDDHIGRFDIGVSNYTTNRALVYIIEAARLLCGADNKRALKLLAMAAAEIESR